MMLLIGIKISLTKNPTNPITTKPIAVRTATLENSTKPKKQSKFKIHNIEIQIQRRENRFRGYTFAIGFVATLNEPNTVFGEFSEWIEDGINGVHFLAN